MTPKQWVVSGIMLLMIFMWITDKTVVASIIGFPLGLGGVAMTGTVLYMVLGLTSWSDYEKNVSWGVIIRYAGAISLGSVFKTSGAAKWLADSLIGILGNMGIESGLPLIIFIALIGALMTNFMRKFLKSFFGIYNSNIAFDETRLFLDAGAYKKIFKS